MSYLIFSNTTLNGKKVEASFHKAFKIIFDRVGELMGEKIDQNKIFEHLNKPVNKEKSRAFGSAHPIWLRAAQELRTVIQGGWHSYAMDAAVKVLRNEEPFDEETMRWMEKVHPQTNSR